MASKKSKTTVAPTWELNWGDHESHIRGTPADTPYLVFMDEDCNEVLQVNFDGQSILLDMEGVTLRLRPANAVEKRRGHRGPVVEMVKIDDEVVLAKGCGVLRPSTDEEG